MLPSREHTALLLACLATGGAAHDAWKSVARDGRRLPELFRTDHGDFRRLGPLLAWNLRRNDIQHVDAALLTVLRTSLLREELRSALYRDILGEVIEVLTQQDIAFIVMAGAALGVVDFPSPELRHAHDIDLLLEHRVVEDAAAVLVRAGYRRVQSEDDVVELRHARELPVRLNTGLFHLSCHPSDYPTIEMESRTLHVGSNPTRMLSREDAFALALGRAAYSSNRMNLQWACDAWMIASHGPLCIDRILETLSRARLLPTSAVFARYLLGLGASLSDDLLDALEQEAGKTSSFDRDLALHALRRSTHGGFQGALRRMPAQRDRLNALAWMLFPSQSYVRWAHNREKASHVSVTYVARIFKAMRALR